MRSSETADLFKRPPGEARSVRAVTAVVLAINLSLDGFIGEHLRESATGPEAHRASKPPDTAQHHCRQAVEGYQ